MKTMTTAVAVLIMMILPGSIYPAAQQQMGGQMQMGGQAQEQGQPPSQQPMMGMMCPMMSGASGMSGGMGMMSMMPGMMGGQMRGPGMGMIRMMARGRVDSKTMGKILQFRGDMLKAMGEVMLKHGKAMEEAK